MKYLEKNKQLDLWRFESCYVVPKDLLPASPSPGTMKPCSFTPLSTTAPYNLVPVQYCSLCSWHLMSLTKWWKNCCELAGDANRRTLRGKISISARHIPGNCLEMASKAGGAVTMVITLMHSDVAPLAVSSARTSRTVVPERDNMHQAKLFSMTAQGSTSLL